MTVKPSEEKITRRSLLKECARYGIAAGLLGSIGILASKGKIGTDTFIWQIDPHKCIACGKCAYRCNKMVSAVKCFQNHAMCGFCDLCTGFFNPQLLARNEGAENQLCPTDAFTRTHVEHEFFEYLIDHDRCIGCGVCVDGCFTLGNGSLFLQISQEECIQCNQCRIALYCPVDAIVQIPAEQAYLFKET